MYVGRFIAVGKTEDGTPFALYGVCSRSFPDRTVEVKEDRAHVVPTDPETALNPYVTYTCMRVVKGRLVVTNGAQTDPIADRISRGEPDRDAVIQVTYSMDYEHDEYDTPRISAAVSPNGSCWMGKVGKNEVEFRLLEPEKGQGFVLSVYGEFSRVPELPNLEPGDLDDPLSWNPVRWFDHWVCGVLAVMEEGAWKLTTVRG